MRENLCAPYSVNLAKPTPLHVCREGTKPRLRDSEHSCLWVEYPSVPGHSWRNRTPAAVFHCASEGQSGRHPKQECPRDRGDPCTSRGGWCRHLSVFPWPCALRSRKAWHNRGLTLSLRARKLRPERLREWPGQVLFAHSGRQGPASQNLGVRRNLRLASSLEAGMPRHSRDLAGRFRCERWPVTARTPGRCIWVHPVRGNHYVHVTRRQDFKMQKLGHLGG